MKDLMPHHAPKSVAGLTLAAAVENADEHAKKQRKQLAHDRRRLRRLEREVELCRGKDVAYSTVFQPSPEVEQFRLANAERLLSTLKQLHRLREKLGPLAIAAAVAFAATFPALFPATSPDIDCSLLQRAPHEAAPARTQPDVKDDVGRAFSRWI